MENDSKIQFVVKAHTIAGTFALGTYQTLEEAESIAQRIAEGDDGYFDTQRGSAVRFTQMPVSLEVIGFRPKERNRV